MNRITECGMLIKQISDSIARMSNNELRKSGLTLSQLRYLEYLSESQNEPTPFKELEAHFMVSPAHGCRRDQAFGTQGACGRLAK